MSGVPLAATGGCRLGKIRTLVLVIFGAAAALLGLGRRLGVVEVRLMYFDGCPSWQLARTRLRQVLDRLGRSDVSISEVQVETADEATAAAFAGSPTILIDGWDLFPASTEWTGGLGCRLYPAPAGSAGAPRVEDIVSALSERV